MLFTSQPFLLCFIPLCVLAFYGVGARRQARLAVLLLASLVFYAWWDVRFVPLLAGTALVNWLIARAYQRQRCDAWIAAGVALNLLVLGLFKYTNFVLATAFGLFNQPFSPWSIILPLGVSFFTFQQISYLIDLKRGHDARYGFGEFASYVCFFPHLIAGPIIRHHELIPQFARLATRAIDHETIARGLVLFILGLSKKIWLADELAPIADAGFAASAPSPLLAWQSALAYSLQLYFDFSGYTDMALGLACLFGLQLPQNFAAPYRATSVREFWRRWHMTLSRFLRDYLYVPLGGSRHGALRAYAAALTTMLLCGLWHGAGWTFVAWGGLHGLAVCCNQWWLAHGRRLPAALGWLLTMLFVIVGWVLFRAEDFTVAARMLAAMGGRAGRHAGDADDWTMLALGAACALCGPTSYALAHTRLSARRMLALPLALALVACIMRVGQGRALEFIYFQF
jgi:D-alanyl-lipoteichoic acid acyltransferase DltB (MBOAT superfamily)